MFVEIHNMDNNNQDCNCHGQKTTHGVDKRARNKLLIACVMSILFIIAEGVGGYLANSLAIVSDAAHLLADLASFLISLLALHFASRRPTKKLSFGWYRAEILGALVTVYLLWMVTCVLFYVAVERVIQMDFTVNATIMLITASCGVFFNLIMMLTLHPGGHGHSHKSDRGNGEEDNQSWLFNSNKEKLTLAPSEIVHGDRYTSYGGLSTSEPGTLTGEEVASENKKHSHKRNINVTASFLHVVGDLLQSIGALTAAVIIYFKPEWKLADPICTFVFSVIVMATTIPVLRQIVIVLMEGTPQDLDFQSVHESLKTVPEVKDIHDLRIWSLSMDKMVLSVHVAVSKSADAMVVLRQVSSLIRSQHGITETNIQVEEYMADMLNCTHCNDLKE